MALSLDQAQAEPTPAQAQRRVLVIFGGLMLALLISSLDQTIVSTALPTIVSDLGGLSQLSWVITGYLLASTVSTPLWGKLGDLYGRKPLFQASIVLFLAGSALCGLSQNMVELIVFRAVQGLGAGGLLVLAQAIIADVVPPRDRGRYQGLFGAVFGVTSVGGPLPRASSVTIRLTTSARCCSPSPPPAWLCSPPWEAMSIPGPRPQRTSSPSPE
jgi:MFS family permease